MAAPPKTPRGWFRRGPSTGIGFWSVLAIVVLLTLYAGVLEASRPHVSGDQLSLTQFLELTERGRVRTAEVLDYDSYVVGRYARPDGSTGEYNVPYLKAQNSRERLTQTLVENRVPTTVNQQTGKSFVVPATILLPALMLVVVMVYLILSYRRGTGLFGVRSGARKFSAEDSPVTFADIAGQDAAVTELREVAEFVSDPERFARLGVQIPRGVLLYGPPGCGKTLAARALAGEAGASFYSISGSDFVELYVGVGASRVRDLFREAREDAPAIVFIDELDSIGRRRTAGGAVATGSRDEQDQALNSILSEMDGFSPREGIIVLGATNRPDVLDPALLRPGRFDRAIGLESPDEDGRVAILEVHARAKVLGPDVDLRSVAHRAIGMTGADLANVVNEAGLLAARARREGISQADLDEALTRIMEAPERQRRLSMRDRSLGQRTLADEQVSFADVAGVDEAIQELAEVRDYLAEPERFTSMGARIPRGFLLSGPPGCGKTLLARAVAGESNAAFFSVAGSELTEIFVGEGAARVRDLFAQARGVAPAIIFIDEIDAIGSRRGVSLDGGSREMDQTLNQILTELDGFGQRPGVVVMAATNRPDILDPALVRPGRFDRQVVIDLPDRAGRRAILDVHAKSKPLSDDVNLDRLAGLTRGLSGADLANLMNEAALLAGRRGAKEIDMSLVNEGIERALAGLARDRVMSDEERRVTAYHEAGHGLVARALPGGGRIVHKLTIVPRGHTLGSAWIPEESDRLLHSRSLLIERMAVSLGGRVAEQIVVGELWEGAASDLARVGEIARRMVCELGMSEAVGPLPYPEKNGRAEPPRVSEETARVIDVEVRRLVDEAEELARSVLLASREALDRVARALIERETLTLEDVEELAGAPPAVAEATLQPTTATSS
ncbi:MAG: ATP-dependent zinc metalloprotease FtsH [Actinomycetota bacterium]|nr:ATP-dependent zinc metalloprotease FtsH [Actinomycetota bacterium]